jgi:hypothetical protein
MFNFGMQMGFITFHLLFFPGDTGHADDLADLIFDGPLAGDTPAQTVEEMKRRFAVIYERGSAGDNLLIAGNEAGRDGGNRSRT